MKKRLLSLLLAVVMVLTLLPFSAFAEEIVASGTCGENATWALDENGKLTISGTGPMNDGLGPWHASDSPGDSSVKEIYIEDGITSIGVEAFFGQNELKSVHIPDSVTSIGESAFMLCSIIESIEIPESVTSIDAYAFSYCQSLKLINLPGCLTFIGANAFEACTSLASLEIPGSVKKINESAFGGCENLTSVTINEGVRSIPRYAFANCKNLESISIPSSVKLIGNFAFENCDKLKDVYYAGNKADWKDIFWGVDGNESILLDANIHYSDEETPAIAAPEITVSINATSGKPVIKWNAVDGAAKYEVWRSTSKDGTYTRMSTVSGTSLTNKSANAGTKYFYKVRAVTDDGTLSDFSAIKSIVCDCEKPVVKATNVASSGRIKLSWNKITGAEKYEVYRATSKNGTYSKIGTATSTSYTDTTAKAGKMYYYKVKAICANTNGNSAYSAIVSRTCDLARPTAKIALTSNHPKVSWAKITGATKYEVYCSTSKSGTYTKVATVTGTSYTDKNAKKGKTYYYKVKAVCKTSAAASAFSSVVSIKAK